MTSWMLDKFSSLQYSLFAFVPAGTEVGPLSSVSVRDQLSCGMEL